MSQTHSKVSWGFSLTHKLTPITTERTCVHLSCSKNWDAGSCLVATLSVKHNIQFLTRLQSALRCPLSCFPLGQGCNQISGLLAAAHQQQQQQQYRPRIGCSSGFVIMINMWISHCMHSLFSLSSLWHVTSLNVPHQATWDVSKGHFLTQPAQTLIVTSGGNSSSISLRHWNWTLSFMVTPGM